MSDLEKQTVEQQFINRLKQLKESDKGAIAKLKRNAGNILAESRGVHAIFYRLLPPNTPRRHEQWYFLVATLFPLAESASKGSLGFALRLAKDKNKTGEKGYDRRIEVLLDADADQLSFRLRQVIRLLKSAEVAVNWEQLLKDLKNWNYVERSVQERWARDYFTN